MTCSPLTAVLLLLSSLLLDLASDIALASVDAQMQEREAFFRAMVGPKGQSALRLSKDETSAVVLFLCLHVDAFKRVTDLVVTEGKVSDGNGGQVSLTRVRELLAACTVEDCDVVPENERVPAVQRQLYTAGQSTETCTLVLTGRLKIVAGVEGFVSEAVSLEATHDFSS